MTSLGEAHSPCTLGFWWGLEGTELTAFALASWLFLALGRFLLAARAPHHLCPQQTSWICKQETEALGFSVHYLSSTFSTSRQLRPQPGMNTN